MRSSEWITVLTLVVGAYGDNFFNVNDLMDGTLKKLSARVSLTGDVTFRFGQLSAGGYTLQGARLADLSSLSRAGDCWMWSADRTFFINGTLKLDYMFVVADKVTGPVVIDEPLITVQQNSIVFFLQVEMDENNICHMNYSVSWPVLNGVTLYPGKGSPVNVGKLVASELPTISAQLSPSITRLFEDYGDMCEGQVLSKVEMIKYQLDNQILQQELQH